jgi:hypothetical protein
MTQQIAVAIEEQDAQIYGRPLEFEAHGVGVQSGQIVRVDIAKET